jgi:FMN-dependent NADH-azoreductase
VFGVDPRTGYSHLLEGRGKKTAVIYTSAVWAPGLRSAFGSNFESTYFEDWLRWTGITDITQVRYHPSLNGHASEERRKAHESAGDHARSF